MSVVTDVILTCSIMEDVADDDIPKIPAIDFVNNYLRADNRGELNYLNGNEGGTKYWQVNVYGGAFNWLSHDDFVRVLVAAPWRLPECVTLLIKGEEDETMREFRITERSGYNAIIKLLATELQGEIS